MIDLLLLGVLWGLVIYGIYRGCRKERRIDRFAVLTWLIFMFIALLSTFRIPTVVALINGQFDGHPVAYWLNTLSTIMAATLYSISLMMLHQNTGEAAPLRYYHRWYLFIAPVAAVLLCLALAASFENTISREQAYHLMRFVLAAYILLLVLAMFIPINWWMFQHESVFPMRCKHLAMVIGLAVYASGAAVAVLLVPLFLLTRAGYPDFGEGLRAVIGGACIVVILVPHRWIVLTLLPLQLYQYLRVAALERKVAGLVPMQRMTFDWRQVVRSQYIEMATYIAVINILDNYRRINFGHKTGQMVYRQIEALLPLNPDYDDLVKAMGRVSL